ncbi:MFS transporter [Aquihabitans sp. McL0605]|uniref:MFS transporter n=1 Tax=Aquihabitans sp. McL0605 TaxID=3415671 RepID=UPI003CFACB7C
MDDVRRVVVGRCIRGFADGFVSVLLAQYLTDLGFSPLRVGAIVTGTLLGSAALTLAFGLRAHRTTLGRLLVWACVLMAATGAGFAATTSFWPLLVIAVVGTMNPSSGDVSVFLPTEQAFIAHRVEGRARTRQYAVYNLGAVLAGAVGALASGLPARLARATGWELTSAQRLGFVLYALAALVILALYRSIPRREPSVEQAAVVAPLGDAVDDTRAPAPRPPALGASRRIVLDLAALFSLDSAGSGFVVTSMLVLWLHLRFDLTASTTAGVFFAAGLLGACSQLLAPVLADRFGMVRTMAFTHMPANVLLALAAFAPSGAVAIALLLVRALFAQMDVPARQAFVMAVVPAHERAAASSITNVPRSLASATTPLIAGALLTRTTFGWPLLIAGTVKFSYDVLLLVLHRNTPEGPVDGVTPAPVPGPAA